MKLADDQSAWDIETITDQILGELIGSVPRSTVQQALKEVAPYYESARIQTFVPILIRREAINRLRTMQAEFESLVRKHNDE